MDHCRADCTFAKTLNLMGWCCNDGIARGGGNTGTRAASVAGVNNETAAETPPPAIPSRHPDCAKCNADLDTDIRSCLAQPGEHCRWPDCPCPKIDNTEPWTNYPIVYQNEIRDPVSDESIRMDFDAVGQVRLEIQNGEHRTVHVFTDEHCRDLMHLIMRGLNHVERVNRTGWAA